MHSTSYVRDMTIGLAFLGAIVVMGYVTLKVTDVPFLGDPQNIEVTFDQVGGLRTGDEIRLLGFPVGPLGASSFVRRNATVTISAPLASAHSRFCAKEAYFPLPMMSRDRNVCEPRL